MEFQSRLDDVRRKIALACLESRRNLSEITMIAVSKNQSVLKMREAILEGVSLFGENYVNELEEKAEELPSVEWHFIGHLQSNKAKRAVELCSMIHSIDSVKLAAKINSACSDLGKKMPALIEVNIAEESSKSGIKPSELHSFVKSLSGFESIEIQGIMCLPPLLSPEKEKPFMVKAKKLLDSLHELKQPNLNPIHLSLGTSHDFEPAIKHGATILRLGSALFGERA